MQCLNYFMRLQQLHVTRRCRLAAPQIETVAATSSQCLYRSRRRMASSTANAIGQQVFRPLSRDQCRRFSSSKLQDTIASSGQAKWHGQTVVCDKLLGMDKKEFLTRIQPLSPSVHSSSAASAVVLVTKQFAPLLAHNDSFLHDTLQKLWSQHPKPQQGRREVSVLAAVVDSITGPATSPSGAEGVAICASESLSLVETAVDDAESSPELHTRALKLDEQPPTITLQCLDEKAAEDGALELTLPIASTIFHVNRPSVISLSRWSFEEGNATKEFEGRKKNGNYIVKLPMTNVQPNLSSFLPLAQLTGPRKIKSVMGNVIRELAEAPRSLDLSHFAEIVGQEGGGVTSASRELEEAVAALITMPDKFSTPLQIWALVIPAELTSTEEFSALTRSTNMTLENIRSNRQSYGSESALHNLILQGASLRRVLSGGGGWGNKAGLISLDPYSDYAQRSSDDRFDLEGSDPMSFLRGTATSGDHIVFFALVDSIKAQSTQPRLCFGVVPSTMDSLPIDATESSVNQVQLQYFPNHFGFLSELGMSITKCDRLATVAVRSRIDAPFSRICFDLEVDHAPA